MASTDPLRAAFGRRLQAAREANDMTQPEVGEKFGVGKGTVSAWETGGGDPGVFRLARLVKLYGVSADDLLFEPGESVAIRVSADEHRRVIDFLFGIRSSAPRPPTLADTSPPSREQFQQPATKKRAHTRKTRKK